MSGELMTFMEFNRQLEARGIDKQTGYMLAVLCEQQLHLAKQMDQCSSILVALTKTVEQFTQLHEATQGKVQALVKEMTGSVEGVSVHTEPGQGN